MMMVTIDTGVNYQVYLPLAFTNNSHKSSSVCGSILLYFDALRVGHDYILLKGKVLFGQYDCLMIIYD